MSGTRSSAAAVDDRRGHNEPVDLTPEEEEALLEAIAEDEQEDVIPLEELLGQLRR
ncbi:uncharacterized protein SOCE26_101160 [Sorangium cellulosum]|uniref:Uncharacterized protein n=1 Tax=Sorangium cellulosum TaxID=56 RepID=A0A2L0FAF4_SORCE|nr:hypothetical protein [Sorangium cellulosum]AUX48578.1 uncharacterized protein SOCE26_101160 [Sorangium cellulosum]